MGEPEALAYDLSALDVVVVDDNRFMLKVMEAMLNAIGVQQIRCLDDPTQVFAQIDAQPAHLLITDILMRPIDGIELTKTIRAWGGEVVPFTPIFALSGLTDRKHVLRAAEAGVHEVLAKPISPRQLYGRIQRTIDHPADFIRSDTYFGPDRRSSSARPPSLERRGPGGDEVVYI